MVEIKNYTDIDQSKKLSEILPLESADMYYEWPNKKVYFKDDKYSGMGFSCWSLAALLSVIAQSVRIVGTLKDSYWYCECDNGNNQWYVGSESADNPVDACVNMIEKLHELKML